MEKGVYLNSTTQWAMQGAGMVVGAIVGIKRGNTIWGIIGWSVLGGIAGSVVGLPVYSVMNKPTAPEESDQNGDTVTTGV